MVKVIVTLTAAASSMLGQFCEENLTQVSKHPQKKEIIIKKDNRHDLKLD